MQTQDLEPETEALFLRVRPGLADRWQGASDDEIAALESVAGCTLPRFYRWFLARLGRSAGLLEYRSLDFSLEKILSCYREGLVAPDPRWLMIGYETDEIMPLHLFYDLARPARDDAFVLTRDLDDGSVNPHFETFREMLGWGEVARRVMSMPQRCVGALRAGAGVEVLATLAPLMSDLGFQEPIRTGTSCGLHERADAAMAISRTPRELPSPNFSFDLGGPDSATLRRILGVVTTRSPLECKIKEWNPSLPGPG
jgi:hypothetical protein